MTSQNEIESRGPLTAENKNVAINACYMREIDHWNLLKISILEEK